MTKQEFETLAGVTVTNHEYDKIQFVYVFHPCISNVNGKSEIVTLWKLGGMRLMLDMTPTAEKAKELEEARQAAYVKMIQAQREYDELKRGY